MFTRLGNDSGLGGNTSRRRKSLPQQAKRRLVEVDADLLDLVQSEVRRLRSE